VLKDSGSVIDVGLGYLDDVNLLSIMTQRITVDPGRCGGRPCIRNTRIRVRDILDLLGSGADEEEILRDYPLLEPEDLSAAVQYRDDSSTEP